MTGIASKSLLAVSLLAASVCAQVAQATIVHLSGSTVDFYYDDAQPGMAAYGALTAVGDSIFAQPSGFLAAAVNGASDNSSVLGTVTVVARPGYAFDLVQVAQQGDYTLSGGGASVSATSSLDVADSTNNATSVTTPLASSSNFALQGTHNWSSLASVDLSSVFWNGVNSIELSLDTLLVASTSSNGESAQIQNKVTGGGLVTVMTSVVPLPASIWLFGAGLALLARVSRRRAA